MISFTVQGQPVAQGSKRAFVIKGRAVMTEASKHLKPWRTQIAAAAREQMGDAAPVHDPVHVTLHFTFPRPKSHYGTGKNAGVLKPGSVYWHATKPDADKLARAILDALTGVVYRDDSQVCLLTAGKSYGESPSARVEVRRA